MVVQRLPVVNSDDGVWGDIIRQYLMKEHYNDDTDNPVNGGHQKVTIRAGTATAGTAPLKFTSGTLMTAPEAGATEFAGDNLYFTITSGAVRKKVALYDDSSGATGDIYYRNGTGYLTRLPIGGTNKTLRVSGGLPAWADADINPAVATSTKTSGYTITGTDVVIFADASISSVTITLPTASSFNGYNFYVKRIDGSANNCLVARSGSDTIDGATSFSLDTQYFAVRVVSNGSNWYII